MLQEEFLGQNSLNNLKNLIKYLKIKKVLVFCGKKSFCEKTCSVKRIYFVKKIFSVKRKSFREKNPFVKKIE